MSLADWFSGRAWWTRKRTSALPESVAVTDIPTGASRPEDTADSKAEAVNEGRTDTTLQAERAIPSVNRVRSVQARISNALALGVMLLLGGGLLVWYYSTLWQHHHKDGAKRSPAASVETELKVPPLGPLTPTVTAPTSHNVPLQGLTESALGPAPLPPYAQGSYSQGSYSQGANAAPGEPDPTATTAIVTTGTVTPQKSSAALALERKLFTPVMLRGATQGAINTANLNEGAPSAVDAAQLPTNNFTRASGAAPFASSGGMASTGSMPELLTPTATPRARAQLLPSRRFLLPKGAFIDCTLETAIDSSYPGMFTCVGAHDVFSADGSVLLLERGTKYVGESKGEVRLGQARVFALWNEARTPHGVVVNLASPGTDELGRSGLPGQVNTHFWERFGAAILISVIDGTFRVLAANQQSASSGSVVLNSRGANDVLTEVLKSTVAIPPTVVKNQGDRIQILVARDVDFRSVYQLKVRDE